MRDFSKKYSLVQFGRSNNQHRVDSNTSENNRKISIEKTLCRRETWTQELISEQLNGDCGCVA